MIYFYAGLGAAMLTGIMLLFDIGLALTGQSLEQEQPKFEAYQDAVNLSDQLFQRMLTEPQDIKAIGTGLYGFKLCGQIICRIQGVGCHSENAKNPLYAALKAYSRSKSIPPSGVWSSSCVLEREIGNRGVIHRLLIRSNRDKLASGYELYSCIVEDMRPTSRCSFEGRP